MNHNVTGEMLYSRYEAALLELQNCYTEQWAALPAEDQAIWDRMAENLLWESY